MHCMKYACVARMALMNSMAYLGDFIARSLLMVVFLFTFAQIWTKTLPGGAHVAGLTAVELVWYMALTETVMLSMHRMEGAVVSDVKGGAIGYMLARPMSYVSYQFATFLGETLVRLVMNGVVGAATAWVLVGPIYVPPIAVLAWMACVVAGMSLSFAMSTSLALTSFWVEDSMPFFWIYNKLLFTLGGLFAPISIYPGILKDLAQWSPFNFVFAAPAKLLVDFSLVDWTRCALGQAMWLATAFALAGWVFRKGARQVNVNGG